MKHLKTRLSVRLLIAVLIFIPPSSIAGVEKLIKNVMPKGTMSNVSRGAIVNDQLAGHIVGGSVLLKTPPAEEFQPISMQAPTCKLGGLPCAAQMDLRAGALSFIKTDQMERFFKDVAQGAGGYLAILAIKTRCPQCENIMSYLEQMARNVNQFNINACEKGMQIAKGLHSAWEKGAEQTRQASMVIAGSGQDMNDIRRKARRDDGGDPTYGRKELESLLGDNFNLVWKALEQKTESAGDGRALKELLMSISGTIIGKKDPEKGRVIIRKGSLANDKLIEDYIGVKQGNAEIELYVCDEPVKCLNITKQKIMISAKDTLYGRIDGILATLIPKVADNKGELNEEESNLIALSSIPIIKKIQMELAQIADTSNIGVRVAEFIEVLCYDVITNHLTRLLNKVNEAVSELSYLQLADIGVFKEFETEVSNTIRILTSARENAFRRYGMIQQTKMRIRQEEEYFKAKFEDFIKINNFEG